jgi:hypothetical protein
MEDNIQSENNNNIECNNIEQFSVIQLDSVLNSDSDCEKSNETNINKPESKSEQSNESLLDTPELHLLHPLNNNESNNTKTENECEGCEHCCSDFDDYECDGESENNDSDSDSDSDSSNDSTDSNKSDTEYCIEKYPHVIKYFLFKTDELEERINRSTCRMISVVAPLYVALGFVLGAMYG